MKSDCEDYQKRIAALLLGDLSAEESELLEEHFSECSNCISEKKRYIETVDLLKAAEDEHVPRHFFVYPREMESNPWKLFLQLKRPWQVATAFFAILFLLLGIAEISAFHIRSNADGWAVGFGSNVDVAALKADLMHAIIERDNASAARMTGIQADLGGLLSDLAAQQQATMAALVQQDALLDRRIALTEDRLKAENRDLVLGVYDAVTKERVQDLGRINFRLDSFENNYAVKELQTNQLLSMLLQETNRQSQ